MVDACVHLMKTYSGTDMINIGTGEDISIADFARLVASVVGSAGAISYDASRPTAKPQKLLDVSRLAKPGWRAHLASGRHPACASGLSERVEAGGPLGRSVPHRRSPEKWNANHALKLAHRGYVMVNGLITLKGTGSELLERAEVRAAYLEGGRRG